MLEILIATTAAVCGLATVVAYFQYRDVFHPLIFITPMFAFIYVYMPLHFIRSGELFTFVSERQAIYVQSIVVGTLVAFVGGCFSGSRTVERHQNTHATRPVSAARLHIGAYAMGLFGIAAWAYTIRNVGGITGAFGEAYGSGWSDFGYIREAVYLLIAALLLLLSREGFAFPQKKWTAAVVVFSLPWLIQALLGARRGPTFMITVTIVMSWFLARRKRPSPIMLAAGGLALGFFMLFLVTNRGNIYVGANIENLKTDVSDIAGSANEANEYIFGAGCIVATDQSGRFYWGRRYLAQILVRPIPHQLWPTKYEDVGVPELVQNAGAAVGDIQSILGWKEVPGAAAAMVGDLWVEFSWLALPVSGLIGWLYGYCWRRAVRDGMFWVTQYTILALLSIYLVTQSMEAVIFRFVILSGASYIVWRKAQTPSHRPALLRVSVADEHVRT